jgi:hypothetical protein
MTLILSGTDGLSDVDGSASTPAIRGTDANTGIFFPSADTIAFAEGGAEVARFDSSGNLGIGTSSPLAGYRLSLTGGTGLNIQNTGASDNTIVKYSNSGKNWYVGLRGDTGNVWAVADDAAFRMVLDNSGNLQFNSGYGSAATAYGCRAWVNFNGTGTPAIRGSGNVTSITDNGVGNYTLNFTTAMPDANYALVGSGQYQTSGGGAEDVPSVGIVASNINANSLQTGSANIGTSTDTAAAVDPLTVCVAIFR